MNKLIAFLIFVFSINTYANRIMKFNNKVHRISIKNRLFSVEVNSVNKFLKKESPFQIYIKNNSLDKIKNDPKSANINEELRDKAQYLFGLNFKELLRDYKVSYNKGFYSALDTSGEKEVSEYLITMKRGKISKIIMKRAIGTTTFYYKWSYNKKLRKYYPNKITVKSFEGVYNKVKEIKFIYTTKRGLFFPAYIGEVSSIHLVSSKKNKKISQNYVDWTKFQILK